MWRGLNSETDAPPALVLLIFQPSHHSTNEAAFLHSYLSRQHVEKNQAPQMTDSLEALDSETQSSHLSYPHPQEPLQLRINEGYP